MNDHRDTDERLKNRLNGDQIARERMCLAILALDPQYSQIEPRRPEGGPDQARDIQAKLRDASVVWGAVGFQNSVTDSPEDKRNAKGKFREDLDAALEKEPGLRAFVFFTNVDLTPGEVEELRATAAAKGVTNLDVYWRERLRHALDSPQGLGLRYQYLKLPLTEAEQASFFSSFGAQIENLILRQGENVQEGVRRLEFLHWMSRPLRNIKFQIHFDGGPVGEDMGRFRVVCKLTSLPEEARRGWWIGGYEDYLIQSKDGEVVRRVGSQTVFSNSDPTKLAVPPGGVKAYGVLQHGMSFGIDFGKDVVATPEFLEGRVVRVFATKNLARHISRISLHINGYALAHRRALISRQTLVDLEWPESAGGSAGFEWFCEESLALGWIDFSHTPKRSEEIPYLASPTAPI